METKRKALGKGLEQLFSNEVINFENFEKNIVESTPKSDITKILLSEIRSNPYQIEITDKFSTKANALLAIAKAYGIDQKDTIAVGDAGNDCSMIQAAGIGIAVKNAEDSAKSVADVVLEYSNEEDAIMHIIKSYT